MNSYKVGGKIVFCEAPPAGEYADGTGILIANGLGTIMVDPTVTDTASNYPLPATVISAEDGQKVLDYIRTSAKPIAAIMVGETWKDTMAPIVASFSSRGPNPIIPDILKGIPINSFNLNGISYPLIWGGHAANCTDVLIQVPKWLIHPSQSTDSAYSYPLPATVISREDGLKVLDYIRSSK
ncbi:hypothetical protein RJ639_015574 [Escallonia herrerae]|uniref:Uncharacterized protein n=1 Tax=Escallonia herrerae TaxID=1293975 RepID=A0AA89AM93_9ASTE|nr:hypothetical protein RJ639_015574 [Escallonia herrerae]